MSNIELVVARYREDVSWLNNVPRELRITVYDKSDDSVWPGSIELPNLGREAHTYLHHLVARYNTLADVTIFCQGKPFDHAYDFHKVLRGLCAPGATTAPFQPIGHLIDTDTCDGARLFSTWSKNENGRGLDLRSFHHALWGTDGPREYPFRGGAQFSVTRDCALRQSREFYENALELSLTFPDAAHCFERCWPLVFGIDNPDLELLNGRQTLYLKPVKAKSSDFPDAHNEARPCSL